jgi:hypothetical protein
MVYWQTGELFSLFCCAALLQLRFHLIAQAQNRSKQQAGFPAGNWPIPTVLQWLLLL